MPDLQVGRTAQPARRARSRRAALNDERLRLAASSCVLRRGWDAVSFLGVAQEAGLTTRPMYDRFQDTSEMGVDLWRNQAGPLLGRALEDLLDAALEQQELRLVVNALEPFIRPGDALSVAAELIAAAPYDDQLSAALSDPEVVGAITRCQPASDRTATQAAQATYLLIVALGLLMIRTRPQAASVDVTPDAAELLKALKHPGPVAQVADLMPPHMRSFVADDPDPRVSSILTATLTAVAERGYSGATTEYIAACAGVSQGAVFARYSSKLQLFIEATGRQQAAAFRANYKLSRELTDQLGAGRAEATMMRAWLRPEHQPGRALVLEQTRLSWHDEAMRAVVENLERRFMDEIRAEPVSPSHQIRDAAGLFWDLALGQGCSVAGVLVPWAWQLPMSVVTIPLLEPSGAESA